MDSNRGAAMSVNSEDLLTLPTDSLLYMREEWKAEANRYSELAQRAEAEVLRRMIQDGASVYASERGEAQAGPSGYDYDMPTLEHLRPLVLPQDWADLVQEVVAQKVNKIKLNQLVRRGGEIATIIEEATKPRPWRLTKVKLNEEAYHALD